MVDKANKTPLTAMNLHSEQTPLIPSLTVLNKDEEKMSDLEKKIRRQVACEERAHRIVEQLLENPIHPAYLVQAGKLIMSGHYQDITEERAIAKMCGYPICPNLIKKTLKQKYKISTKTNKVYDISERKNFCSNKCYKASQYFASQIPTTPIWAREDEIPADIHLMDLSENIGKEGEEIFYEPREAIARELQQIEGVKHKERLSSKSDSIHTEHDGPLVTSMQDLARQVSDMMLLDSESEIVNSSIHCKSKTAEKETGQSSNIEQVSDIDSSKSSLAHNTLTNLEKITHNKVETDRATSTDTEMQQKAEKENLEKFGDKNAKENIPSESILLTNNSSNSASNITKDTEAEMPGPSNLNDSHNNEAKRSQHTGVKNIDRQAPEMTEDKAQLLLDLIDKRNRLKGQLKKAPRDVANSVRFSASIPMEQTPDAKLAEIFRPLSIKTETEEESVLEKKDDVDSLEKEFEEKLKSGNISDIKSLFCKISDATVQKDIQRPQIPSNLSTEACDTGVTTEKGKHNTQKSPQNTCDVDKNETEMELGALKNNVKETVPTDTRFSKSVENTSSLKNDNSCASTLITADSDLQTRLRVTSAKVIDNVRRLVGQTGDLDEDDLLPDTTQKNDLTKVQKEKSRKKKLVKLTPVQFLGKIIQDWVTKDTITFLTQTKKTGEDMSRDEFARRYAALGRQVDKLVQQEMVEEETMTSDLSRPTKKLPDYQQLQRETHLYDLKVREFFSGSFRYPTDIEEPEENIDTSEGGIKEKFSAVKPVLPLVDSRQQKSIRQHIVMDRLDKVLPDILVPMKIAIKDVSGDLREMIATFNLTSQNILLKPAEWTLVGYFLLKLLAVKTRSLKDCLESKQSCIFINIILNKLGSDDKDVNYITEKIIASKS